MRDLDKGHSPSERVVEEYLARDTHLLRETFIEKVVHVPAIGVHTVWSDLSKLGSVPYQASPYEASSPFPDSFSFPLLGAIISAMVKKTENLSVKETT